MKIKKKRKERPRRIYAKLQCLMKIATTRFDTMATDIIYTNTRARNTYYTAIDGIDTKLHGVFVSTLIYTYL